LLTSLFVQSQNVPGLLFGGSQNDVGLTLCETKDSGFLLAGKTRSFGEGSNDIYVVRIDSKGSVLWTKTYGWKHQDVIRSAISVDNGFILVGDVWDYGYWRLDIYLMKIDSIGNLIWDQYYGTNSHDLGFKVKPNENGGYYVLGYTRGIEPIGDMYLIKTDNYGNLEWSQNYGSQYDDYSSDFIEKKNGDIMILGTKGGFFNDIHGNFKNHDADIYLISADDNGNELWQKTFGGSEHDFGQALCSTDDGGLYIFGSSQNNSAGSFDMVLIKTDTSYNEVWRKTYGGPDYEYGMSMDRNLEGDLYLFGTTKSFGENGSADYYLVKANKDGNEIWSMTIGGDSTELGHQVIATSDNGCMVLGQTKSFGSGGYDFLLTKVNKDGTIEYFTDGTEVAHVEDAHVYPNPLRVNGKIKIGSNLQSDKYRMEIISLSGKVNGSFIISPPDYQFSTYKLKPGFYVYRIISEKNAEVIFKGKIIIY